MKSRKRKSACTAATVASAKQKTSCMDNYNMADAGRQGIYLHMVGIGFALMLASAALTDSGMMPLWCAALVCVIGAALMLGGVRDA